MNIRNDNNAICNIDGVIFDMDGVIFDTEKLYERFWIEAGSRYGFKMEVDDVAAIRSTDAKLAKEILQKRISPEFPYEDVKSLRVKLMKEYTDSFGVELKEGIVDLIYFLKNHGIKIALATTSNMKRATDYLNKGNIYSYFDYILSGDMVTNCKPDPEVYEKAAKSIELNTKNCMAIEDSYNGIRSAYEAGCFVVMIPDRDKVDEEMKDKTDIIVKSAFQLLEQIKKDN